jgi:exopolysaccharide biosynthesis polyprenyl glycosylphosphotransferase
MVKIPRLLVYAPIVAVFDLVLIHASLLGVSSGGYQQIAPALSVVSLAILYLLNLYSGWLRRPLPQLTYFIGVAAAMISMSLSLLLAWEQPVSLSLTMFAQCWLLLCGMLLVFRLLLRRFYWSHVSCSRVMVVAADEGEGMRILRKLEPAAPPWIEFVGFILEKDFDEGHSFDAVVLAPGLPQERLLMERCARSRKKVMTVPALLEMSLLRGQVIEMQDLLLVELQSPHLTPEQQMVKRICDLVLAVGLLLLSSPLLLLTAAMIRLTSRGPVLFKQDRVGKDGVEYQLYKFRTMMCDAEKDTGPVLACERDPRITPLGQFLRSTRIDELPQLVNVLRGSMSVIGPRPERRFFVDTFRQTLPDYDLRFHVKPGITGLAQVAGGYATPVEQKLKFDLLYIANYSLLRDISIVFRTIPVILHFERAKGVKVPAAPPITVEE